MPETIPQNREELAFKFKRIAKSVLKESKDGTDVTVLDKLIPELIAAVPVAAFDPLQPFDDGILFYHGTVDEGEVVEFQHDLMRAHMNLDTETPITLNLSSVGGSVFAGLAMISTMRDIQRQGRKINVHVQGVAMSMGSVIAQVADYRTIEPSAFFMLHEVSYSMRGSTADHEEERAFTIKLQNALYEHYSLRTGKPVKYYQDKLKKTNWYLTAQEALDEALVDEIKTIPPFEAVKPKRPRKKAA